MVEKDKIEYEGEVIDSCKGLFKVKVFTTDMIVMCTLAGKIKINSVRILIGDKVKIEVSEYDTSKGRIIFRMR